MKVMVQTLKFVHGYGYNGTVLNEGGLVTYIYRIRVGVVEHMLDRELSFSHYSLK